MKYQFGDKLRQVRKRRGMTMKEVAAQANVSESLISQIERNRISPAIDTLLDIADILNIDMDYLFKDLNKAKQINVVRRNERYKLIEGSVTYERLSRTPDEDEEHGIEAYYMEIAPGSESGSNVCGHKGKELGILISGEGEFCIGNQAVRLQEGDSISFAADSPHVLKNKGDQPLKAFWVVTPPKKKFK
jgi:transcriptional regulator with XRE-family HTH domain